ncbi:MAG: CRTAC1 family protein, partial [Actinomycetota bacterium]
RKVGPRVLLIDIPIGSALIASEQIGIAVRTRFHDPAFGCRPCRDRVPNHGTVSISSSPTVVELEAVGPTAVPLGSSLRFRMTVTNLTDVATLTILHPELAPVGSSSSVQFGEYPVVVGPHSTVSVEDSVVSAQWLIPTGAFELRLPGASHLAFEVTAPLVPVPQFENVTEAAGLATEHVAIVDCTDYSAGAAWGDVNGDGLLDLYLPHQGAPAQLWIQEPGGSFVDEAVARGVEDPDRIGIGAVFADYDNDGDQDLYVVNDGPNRLYENDGVGVFTDVTETANVGDPGGGTSASWGDYDGDGFLDLYVTNYFRCPKQRFDDVLYHNEGDGTFTDVTDLLRADATPLDGLGFQAAWFDYDGDGDLDLLLANDYISHDVPNILWRNDGPDPDLGWRFTNVSQSSGMGVAMNSMGIGVGDYDRDLDLDVAVSNIAPTKLFTNDGGGMFSERGVDAGVARPKQRSGVLSITWGLAFVDLNNDGWEDLYVAAGSLSAIEPEPQPNAVFANAGDGAFYDLSAPSMADDPGVSRGVALADYDRDGRVDVYVVNQRGHPRLYRNVTVGAGHWLEVDLTGTASNADGCGAWLEADLPGGGTLIRQVFCGSVGLGSGSDPVVHLGLGEAVQVNELRIRWPSGTVQTLTDVDADQLLPVTEP